MPISSEKYQFIQDKWGQYASWAIWREISPYNKPKARIGDLSIFEASPELLDTLRTDIVLVALNAADRDIPEKPFSPFHDSNPRAMDFKMRYAFQDTPLWGSYLTDLFHNLRETNSGKVNRYLLQHPDYTLQQIERFKKEMQDISETTRKPVLIALGKKVKELLNQYLGDEFVIYELPHYSFSGINKEEYRKATLDLIQELELKNHI